MIDETKPRQHAVKILRMPTKEQRQRYLAEQVPEKFHELVKTHVRNLWPHRGRIIQRQR